MADPLGRCELRDIMVGQSDRAHLALLLEVEQSPPIIFDRCAVFRRPMHLVEGDTLDPESRQRGLDLVTDPNPPPGVRSLPVDLTVASSVDEAVASVAKETIVKHVKPKKGGRP